MYNLKLSDADTPLSANVVSYAAECKNALMKPNWQKKKAGIYRRRGRLFSDAL